MHVRRRLAYGRTGLHPTKRKRKTCPELLADSLGGINAHPTYVPFPTVKSRIEPRENRPTSIDFNVEQYRSSDVGETIKER